MEIKLSPGFAKRVRGKFEKYQFEVGILEDKVHREAARGQRGLKGEDVLTEYAGGPARKATRKSSGMSVAQVSESFRKHLGVNYLVAPFKERSAEIIKFTEQFFKYAFGKSTERRLTNLLQAIVRNPILRGDYGHNSALTKRIKGFDRLGIDTAQLFKGIKARVVRKGGR